jgi:glutamyl-tRNA synthetase
LPQVRVRFAPSPTGFLHVGGLRTALYNYLFARRQGGVFILRIEDTDRTRFVEGAVDNLIASLRWAGLDYDEGPGKGGPAGPYVQSERTEIYRQHALELVEKGKAYYAFETEEELEQIRKSQEAAGGQPAYDGRALRLSAAEVQNKLKGGVPHVIRMRTPDSGVVVIDDLIRGMVEFEATRIDDQVLVKSDGFPTYHLANVVDDHLMGVTHVIRGEEWLPSTPKHALLYSYFNWEPPRFAHLPLLLNPDRSKMSKRRMQDGKQVDVFVEEYRKRGYLPEALVNFVALLGWNPGTEQEIFSLEELAREFSIERVGKAGAVFDIAKLDWMNGTYIRGLAPDALASRIRPFLEESGVTGVTDEYLLAASQLMKERCETLACLGESAMYLFRDPDTYDEVARKKSWKPESAGHLAEVAARLAEVASFSHSEIETLVRATAERLGVGAGKLIHPLRLALTGVSVGPGLFELMTVLGRETCVRRMQAAVRILG